MLYEKAPLSSLCCSVWERWCFAWVHPQCLQRCQAWLLSPVLMPAVTCPSFVQQRGACATPLAFHFPPHCGSVLGLRTATGHLIFQSQPPHPDVRAFMSGERDSESVLELFFLIFVCCLNHAKKARDVIRTALPLGAVWAPSRT